MAKINTTNYQPVTAWNGTQDLFVVEQPDGTKVATPEQVKQYVEAGDFEATGDVKDGHGNILAKKADITTVTIPKFTPSQAGWRRICKVTGSLNVGSGLLYLGGAYSNEQPMSAIIAINIQYGKPTLVLLSSGEINGVASKIRLVCDSGRFYWIDIYFPVFNYEHGPLTLKFTGDIVVSNIQNPISITTDTTEASAELSLNTAISGTVLTDESMGLLRGSESVIVTNDDGVKQLLTSAADGSVKICVVNPSISSDDTPFRGHVYLLLSAKLRDNLGMQYAMSMSETTNKKRLYTGTWSSWS